MLNCQLPAGKEQAHRQIGFKLVKSQADFFLMS
jgi:hypothetical protein